MSDWAYYGLLWLAMINLTAVAVTVSDKCRARRNRRRIPERTLLLVAALGGSPAMLATMYTIRHKTLHKKFTVGVPVILLLQVAGVLWLYFRGWLTV